MGVMNILTTAMLFRGSDEAAGYDLAATHSTWIWPFQTVKIRTGVKIALPQGSCALVLPRSGIATKYQLAPINAPGLIDSDYRGEIIVALHNYGLWPRRVNAAERVAQLLPIQNGSVTLTQVEVLPRTHRQERGFGSSG